MPELPEVETVKRALVPILRNRQVLSAFVGRKFTVAFARKSSQTSEEQSFYSSYPAWQICADASG